MTSSDVADSLGLLLGRYEYFESQHETSMNISAAAASPSPSMATVSSCCVPPDVETIDTLLPDSAREDRDRTNALFDDANNTSWEAPVDKAADDDTDKLEPVREMGDSRLESSTASDCGGCIAVDTQRETVTANETVSLASSGNTDHPGATAELDRVEYADSDCCVGSKVNGSMMHNDHSQSEGYPIITADVLAADGTYSDRNRLTLTGEIRQNQSTSISDDAFCQSSVDTECIYQPDATDFDNRTHSDTQSDNITEGQQNSLSETVTLLPTAEDLEGLLKVISRTQ